MHLFLQRAPETRAAEGETDPIIRARGGNGDTAASQSGGQGAPVVGSL